MTHCQVGLARSALGDLQDIQDWYAEQGVPEVGNRLVVDILDRMEALADHPLLGRVVPEFGLPFLRELIVPPFRVVYRPDPGRVRIVRVWRSERPLRLPGGLQPQAFPLGNLRDQHQRGLAILDHQVDR